MESEKSLKTILFAKRCQLRNKSVDRLNFKMFDRKSTYFETENCARCSATLVLLLKRHYLLTSATRMNLKSKTLFHSIQFRNVSGNKVVRQWRQRMPQLPCSVLFECVKGSQPVFHRVRKKNSVAPAADVVFVALYFCAKMHPNGSFKAITRRVFPSPRVLTIQSAARWPYAVVSSVTSFSIFLLASRKKPLAIQVKNLHYFNDRPPTRCGGKT